jgi:tricorn protease-like protein
MKNHHIKQIPRQCLNLGLLTLSLILPAVLFQPVASGQATNHPQTRYSTSHEPPMNNDITSRVSVASDGTQADGSSFLPSISADGRYITFYSEASNLVPGDTNGMADIFVHDRQTGETSRVSVASDGTQGNNHSFASSFSADARYVVFHSQASNLIPGDTNGTIDVFVRDRQTEQTSRISIASSGTQGIGDSEYPSISADGRYIAFQSEANNLVPGDTNNALDIFIHDRQTGQTNRVSLASNGMQADDNSYLPSISAGGRYVTFLSLASNLVPGDTNGSGDIFVHDQQTGQTSRISVTSDGSQSNNYSSWPAMSADGRYVSFWSEANNLVPGDTNNSRDVFVYDRQIGQTNRVSVASDGTQGNDHSLSYRISADGRYVVFGSAATNLVPDDTNGQADIFIHDQQTGQTSRVSIASDGTQANNHSYWSSISVDGRYIAFHSDASNLVTGDTNNVGDIFVHDRYLHRFYLPFILHP